MDWLLIVVAVALVAKVRSEPEACAPFPRVMPNFTAPHRSFFTTKCFEAIWELKYQEEKLQRSVACEVALLNAQNLYPIIGGRSTYNGEYPHMAAIGWKSVKSGWVFKCGGTLISSKFVLSAAHCTMVSDRDNSVDGLKPKIVRLGDKNILDSTISHGLWATEMEILQSIAHPKYQAPKKYYDIALFELVKDIEFDSLVVPACLWMEHDTRPLGTEATVTGWGIIDTTNRKTPTELQSGGVSIIPSDVCDRQLRSSCSARKFCGIKDHQICAANNTGKVDACQGDSGGPLQVKINPPTHIRLSGNMHYVVGITSFGIGCARPDKPGVYTRVSYFANWIKRIVWPNN